MIPEKCHPYLAVSAVVAGIIMIALGFAFPATRSLYFLLGSFCILTGIAYLLLIGSRRR